MTCTTVDTRPRPFEVGEESIHSRLLNEIKGTSPSELSVPFKPLPAKTSFAGGGGFPHKWLK